MGIETSEGITMTGSVTNYSPLFSIDEGLIEVLGVMKYGVFVIIELGV